LNALQKFTKATGEEKKGLRKDLEVMNNKEPYIFKQVRNKYLEGLEKIKLKNICETLEKWHKAPNETEKKAFRTQLNEMQEKSPTIFQKAQAQYLKDVADHVKNVKEVCGLLKNLSNQKATEAEKNKIREIKDKNPALLEDAIKLFEKEYKSEKKTEPTSNGNYRGYK
jgi:hypothetical protein